MSDLKPCPYCKSVPKVYDNKCWKLTHTRDCYIYRKYGVQGIYIYSDSMLYAYNTRPIEDKLKAENERLMELLSEAVQHINLNNAPRSLYDDIMEALKGE